MTSIVSTENRITAMTPSAIAKVRRLEEAMMSMPQVKIETEHIIHGGLYSRTIVIPAGTAVTGVVIQIPTTVIVSGHCVFYVGDDVVEVNGCKALAASGYRKQACYAFTDTTWTMIFKTDATTVEDCERQFTDEADRLASRGPEAKNIITITGE